MDFARMSSLGSDLVSRTDRLPAENGFVSRSITENWDDDFLDDGEDAPPHVTTRGYPLRGYQYPTNQFGSFRYQSP
jgi:hypothetical protein